LNNCILGHRKNWQSTLNLVRLYAWVDKENLAKLSEHLHMRLVNDVVKLNGKRRFSQHERHPRIGRTNFRGILPHGARVSQGAKNFKNLMFCHMC
jgi:hypothetical protein